MNQPLLPLGMRAIRRLSREHRYFLGRWCYLRHVAVIVRRMKPRTVLEVGVGPHRFVPGSATLDINKAFAPTYLHDAGKAPWPIESGAVDLVLGLQCWEHFAGRQRLAFREAMRVAGRRGRVLISVPYLWVDADAVHRGIGDARIREWTCGVEPVRRIHVREPVKRNRMILLFRGGDVPPDEAKPGQGPMERT